MYASQKASKMPNISVQNMVKQHKRANISANRKVARSKYFVLGGHFLRYLNIRQFMYLHAGTNIDIDTYRLFLLPNFQSSSLIIELEIEYTETRMEEAIRNETSPLVSNTQAI